MAANPPPTSPTVAPLTRYTQQELGEILGEVEDPFGVAYTGLTWRAKERHFGVRRGGRLVAHTGLVRPPVTVGTAETEVVGFGGVAVAPDLRGQGLARLVVDGAREHARTMGPPYGLLFCRPPLLPLYQRLGRQALAGEVHVEQPDGPVVPLRTMWAPLRDGEHWPEGPVRLRSLPM